MGLQEISFHIPTNYENNKIYKLCIYLIPLVIGIFLIQGQIFLYSNGPITATDQEVPINPTYYFWNIAYPWNPLSLGSPIPPPSLLDIFYGVIAAISFGNYTASQFMVLSLPPILGYFGMLLLTRKLLRSSLVGSIFASFFFAFSPPYLAWFPLPYMIGLSLTPWLFYLGLRAIDYIFVIKRELRKIVFYASSFALVLSLISSSYIHGLPLIIPLFVISAVFLIGRQGIKLKRNHVIWLIVLVSLTAIFFLFGFSKIIEFYSFVTTTEGTRIGAGIGETIKSLWEDGTIWNIVRLTGGSPNIELFDVLESQRYTFFVPLLAFFGLVFLLDSRTRSIFNSKSFSLYLSFFISIGILLLISYVYRELVFSGNPILNNMLLSPFRRPERLIELLSFLYALGIAFTVSIFEYRLTRIFRFKLSGVNSKLRSNKITVFLTNNYRIVSISLLIPLILAHVFIFSLMYISPDDPIRSHQFVRKPSDFIYLNQFLLADEIQSNLYTSNYRYIVIPSYSPLVADLRYNFPNIFYASGFSPNEVNNFVTLTNELITKHDPNVIFPLSLASVKYITTVPPSYSQEELHNWRLRGPPWLSGVNIFGDVENYRKFFSNLPLDQQEYGILTFVNPNASPKIYVPTTLVYSGMDWKKTFESLGPLSKTVDLTNFALIFNSTENFNHTKFVIDDFANGKRTLATVSNLRDANPEFSFISEKKVIDEKMIIVHSGAEKEIYTTDNNLILKGFVPEERDEMSIWVRLPTSNISDIPSLDFKMSARNKTLDDVRFLLRDNNNELIPIEVEKTLLDSDSNFFEVSIIPFTSDLSTLVILVAGIPGSEVEIMLENVIEFKSLEMVGIPIENEKPNSSQIEFYDVITSAKTTLLPKKMKDGTISFSVIEEQQSIDKNSVIVWSDKKEIYIQEDNIVIKATVPPERKLSEGLSIWIPVPSTNISDNPAAQLRITAPNKTLEDFKFDAISESGTILPIKNEKVIDVHNNKLFVSFYPMDPLIKWFRIIILAPPNSAHLITIENSIKFKSMAIQNMETSLGNSLELTNIEFPYLVTNKNTLLTPTTMKNGKFFFSIEEPIVDKKSSFVGLSIENKESGWKKVNEKVQWLSPVSINIDLEIELTPHNEKEVMIPLYFGNAYSDYLQLDVESNFGNVKEVKHVGANGFANLWLIKLDGLSEKNDIISVSMHLYWNPWDLFLHQLRGTLGIIFLLLPFTLLIIGYVRFTSR